MTTLNGLSQDSTNSEKQTSDTDASLLIEGLLKAESAASPSWWDYGKAFLSGLAVLIAGYAGYAGISMLAQSGRSGRSDHEDIVGGENLQPSGASSAEGFSDAQSPAVALTTATKSTSLSAISAHSNPFGRHLLSQGSQVVQITNPIPKPRITSLNDMSILVDSNFTMTFDSTDLFAEPDGDFLSISMLVNGQSNFGSWLRMASTLSFWGNYNTPGNATDVTAQGSRIYVADGFSGLQIIDMRDPACPELLGVYNTPGDAQGVDATANTVYLADGLAGLHVISVVSASAPALLGTYNTHVKAHKVRVHNGYAYVADDSFGLLIVNVTVPNNPLPLGNYNTPGIAYDVFYLGNLAFIADGPSGLHIVNVTDSVLPLPLGTLPVLGSAQGVFVLGTKAYVVAGAALNIVDVSVPSSPFLLGRYNTSQDAQGVQVLGTTAFVAVNDDGIVVVDVGNPAAPQRVGGFDSFSPAQTKRIFGLDSALYAADGTEGIQVLRLNDWSFEAKPKTVDAGNYRIGVIATDSSGGQGNLEFELRVDAPPRFNEGIPNQMAAVGDEYNYFLAKGLVSEPNEDPVIFDAKLRNGQNLPNWLLFNSISGTFTGTPDSPGLYPIIMTVTDNSAGTANTTFLLEVFYKPEVAGLLNVPNTLRGGRYYRFSFSNATFVNLDNHPMSYSAGLENGFSLPSWLEFDGVSRTFSGTPPLGETMGFVVQVRVTDDVTAFSATQSFTLSIVPNSSPEVKNPFAAQTANVGVPFSFVVPDTTFFDPNGDALNITASGMPHWLHFYPLTRTFSGTPGMEDTKTYRNEESQISVIASDGDLKALATFLLSVAGESRWEKGIKISSPILALLSGLLTLYLGRALILNRFCKKRYLRLDHTILVGEVGERIELTCNPDMLSRFKTELDRRPAISFFENARRLFKTRRPYPSGDLPYWLEYCSQEHVLVVVSPGPSADEVARVTIKALDSAGIILEQFKINIVRQTLVQSNGTAEPAERDDGVAMDELELDINSLRHV